jgi:histidine triad (HIT) family protein
MASIFSKIVTGEIPSHKIAETEDFLAFLDINPLAEGHLLVIPKKEVDNLFDLDEATYIGLMLFVKIIGESLGDSIDCVRVGMAVIGLEVPHCHIHLIPLKEVGDINFSKPKLEFTGEELAATAAKIREHIPGN